MLRHFTASALIYNEGRVLLVHHRKLDWWLYPGGHVEPDETPEACLLREVREEVGLDVEILPGNHELTVSAAQVLAQPLAILLEDIHDRQQGHHQHIDLVYVCRAHGVDVTSDPEELNGHGWFLPQELAGLNIPPELPELVRKGLPLAHAPA